MIIRFPTIETAAEWIMNIKVDEQPKTFPVTFRSHFGTTINICYQLINDHRILDAVKCSRPKHLLWALLLLKQYSVEHVLVSQCKTTRKTFRKWTWVIIEEISNLESSLILWKNRNRDWDGTSKCKITVDGTDFSIWEPKPFNSKWWSHKFNGPAVKYEVAVSIFGGDIVWVNGPFKGGESDISIFRKDLKAMLCKDERVEADKGYRGEALHIDLPDEMVNTSGEQRKLKANLRARHETVNGRFKDWGILTRRYRHSPISHASVFRAIVVVTQISLDLDRKALFNVPYETLSLDTLKIFETNDNH